MGLRKVTFAEGEFYHIYSRGNSKQRIFLDDHDYEHFVKLLYLCNTEIRIDFREDIVRKGISAWDFNRGELIVSIGSWVLMPNHFHIYITQKKKLRKSDFRKNAITEFMRKLLTAYSKYFNAKYNRTGSLFEGKFKSVHIKSDSQAKYLFSYHHINPVKLINKNWKKEGIKNKKEAISFLNSYKWSSYLDYKGVVRSENAILDRENFLNYFSNEIDFENEIFDWLNIKEEIFDK